MITFYSLFHVQRILGLLGNSSGPGEEMEAVVVKPMGERGTAVAHPPYWPPLNVTGDIWHKQ